MQIEALTAAWRTENGYAGKGGVVVVFNEEVQGWVNTLRNPEHWVAGCFAVNELGEIWQTIGGDENNGALMWLPMKDPDNGKAS